jgi:hypothetical protein
MLKPLITLDEYKTYTSISSTDKDDRLEPIIKRVSEFVKTYCARSFIDSYDRSTQTFTPLVQYFNTPGQLFTREFPIQEIISVEISQDYGKTYTATENYALDNQNDAVQVLGDFVGTNAYRVTYTAGYKSLPEDLKLAVLDLVDYYYRGESTTRKSNGNVVVEYVTSSDLPPHIKRVLDLYRVL